jgi:hypothetical protein
MLAAVETIITVMATIITVEEQNGHPGNFSGNRNYGDGHHNYGGKAEAWEILARAYHNYGESHHNYGICQEKKSLINSLFLWFKS